MPQTLPKVLPVFPLSGVIIPPSAVLPFTLFEPRYLAMFEEVLKNGRYLILVQPKSKGEGKVDAKIDAKAQGKIESKTEGRGQGGKNSSSGRAKGGRKAGQEKETPPQSLYQVGTLCKVTFFDEDSPTRYRITVMGIQRVLLTNEQPMKRGYRRFAFQRKDFLQDLLASNFRIADRADFFSLLTQYLERFEKDINWDDFKKLDDEKILLVVMITFPFSPAEKQALLEAKTIQDRFDLLGAFLKMAIRENNQGKKPDFWDDSDKRVLQ